MKRQRINNIIIIIIFIGFLIVPLICTDWIGGKVSLTENRLLASFPLSIDYSSGTFSVSRNGVENWICDNIGCRQVFVKTYTSIKNKILGLSTSSLVLVGNDGWYYYTADNNIEIALGDYPLSDADLELIAKYQQNISDYYHSIGKEYILMLTPSKVSVYPEFLPMSDEVVARTPVDIVAEYLSKHTNVIVYNSKDVLLMSKNKGQLYHKTDTHWNEMGSYYVYKGLFNIMKQYGILSGEPICVDFTEGEFKGEFSAMLGNTDLLPAEKAPIAQWEVSFHIVSEGQQFEDAKAIQNAYNPSMECTILQNDNILDGKVLQIYGDSQLGLIRKVPCYLAEHFSKVFNYAIRNVSVVVDEIANPDIVVFSCSERFIKDLLTIPAAIPVVANNISLVTIPICSSLQNNGYSGMWLDYCNSQAVEQQGVIDVTISEDRGFLTFTGWAADFSTMQPLSALYLEIGGTILQCQYGTPRESVSSYFAEDALLNTGFQITFPTEYILNQSISEIQFIQIGTNGTYQFAPVTYSIKTHN